MGGIEHPSSLALHPEGHTLYCASETDPGSVLAFALDVEGQELSVRGQQPSGGAAPCHLAVDSSGRWLIVANYASGSITSFPIDRDGTLGPLAHTTTHEGAGTHPRQTSPHPHAIGIAPTDSRIYVPDLGLDRIVAYELDTDDGSLQPNELASATTPAGYGPRSIAFDASGRLAAVTHELASKITLFERDAETGELTPRATSSTVPSDWEGHNTTASVCMHPSGRFVYASNRGHDSVAVFRVEEDGGFVRVAVQATKGRTPRGCALHPSGGFLIVAHRESDDVTSFRLDARDGTLAAEVSRVTVPGAAYPLFRGAL